MAEARINRLAIATVAGSQAEELTRTLVGEGFYVTEIASTSGFFQETTVSLLIGLEARHLPRLLQLIRTLCRPYVRYVPAHMEVAMAEVQPLMMEIQSGGATVFVLNVERFEQV